jgi:two-component sensor histidine kinase
MELNVAPLLSMPEWLNTTLDLISQVTGGRGGGVVIVNHAIGAIFWTVLLAVAVLHHRELAQPRERLLRWGFGIALGREVFMVLAGVIAAYEVVDAGTLQLFLPPFEQALGIAAHVNVGAGYLRFLSGRRAVGRRYLLVGLAGSLAAYMLTAWWWAIRVAEHPSATFERTWCAWVFHGVASALVVFPAAYLARRTAGKTRNIVCSAFMLLFFGAFLPLPDMALGLVYTGIFTPAVNALQLAAIPLLGMVYVRDLVEQRNSAEQKVSDLAASLEARVAARTAELQKSEAWRQRAEAVEQARSRQALRLQHVLFDLAKADKSDLDASMRGLLRAASQALEVERLSFWVTTPALDSITCRCLYTRRLNAYDTTHVTLTASQFPTYFRALQKMTQVIADDARTHEDTREFAENYLVPLGITSMLDVPVWLRGSLTGILCCEHVGRPRAWTQPEVDFATAVAEMIALALESAERKRAEETLRFEQRRQAALAELEASINREDDLQAVLDRIVETVTTLMPSTASSVVLWDSESETFTISASTVPGQPAQAGAQRVRRTGGASRLIIDSGAPIVTPDVTLDPQNANAMLEQFGMRAFAGVPLLARGKALGVLYAIDREVRHYAEVDLGFLTALASRAAAALMKFRLFESLREANVRLAEEVGERRRAEAEISASLREKESLLREVHHRVKNNLSVIGGLLAMQSEASGDPATLAALRESESRVRAMSLIHERLYQSDRFADVDQREYLEDLSRIIFRAFGAPPGVSVTVTGTMGRVPMDAAIPLGLIVNELLTNSLKYAFPGGRHGRVGIQLSREAGDELRLSFRDDGVGMPPGLDPEKATSLGTRLVLMLTRQLGGRCQFLSDAGTRVEISFPMPEESATPIP